MDDPLAPEDEARLPEVAGQRVASQLAGERRPKPFDSSQNVPVEGMGQQVTFSSLPRPAAKDKVTLTDPAAKDKMSLREPPAEDKMSFSESATRGKMSLAGPAAGGKMSFMGSPAEDKMSFAEPARDKMPPLTLTLTNRLTTCLQEELNLELTRRREIRQALRPVVALAEEILDDHHSTAMLFKVLLALYPHRLDLFTAAIEEAVAVGELNQEVNRGAVFVNVLKELAAEADVELGLQGERRIPQSTAEARDGPPPKVEPSERKDDRVLTEADRIWQAALAELRLQMTQVTFDTWVRNTRLVSCQDHVFVIGAQNEFARDWLANRLLTTVERALTGIVGHLVEARFVVTQAEGNT
jgi:hypothetical protein